jgi:hypothetical protein
MYPRLPPSAPLSIRQAIACCLHVVQAQCCGRAGVLLLVDEVAKMYRTRKDCHLLAHVGAALDAFAPAELNMAIATRDAAHTLELTAVSGRQVVSAPLPPLTQAEAERMLLAAWRGRIGAAASTLLALPLYRYVRAAISDACGHLRTLHWVKGAWLDHLVEDAASPPEDMLEALRTRVIQ